VPERVGLKVLPISTKSRFLLRERPETVGEEQEPPCIYAGEASASPPRPQTRNAFHPHDWKSGAFKRS